jgi:hypothetical protein
MSEMAANDQGYKMELINEVVLNESHSEIWLGGVESTVSAFGACSFSLFGTGKVLVARLIYPDSDTANQALQIMKLALRNAAMDI